MKHFAWIARELSVWILMAAVLISLWSGADKQRKASALQDGRIEFTPNRRSFWAWPVLVGFLIYATVGQVTHAHGRPFYFMVAATSGILTIMIALRFPETIIVTGDGLEQVSWLWKSRRIRWAEIAEINTGENSRSVTITGADGTKIVHSRQLPDRPRLLMEIKLHCGDNLPPDFPREPITGL